LQIVRLKVPNLSPRLAVKQWETVHACVEIDLKKHPSVSETMDWARP